jgi:hypothetical protein
MLEIIPSCFGGWGSSGASAFSLSCYWQASMWGTGRGTYVSLLSVLAPMWKHTWLTTFLDLEVRLPDYLILNGNALCSPLCGNTHFPQYSIFSKSVSHFAEPDLAHVAASHWASAVKCLASQRWGYAGIFDQQSTLNSEIGFFSKWSPLDIVPWVFAER